MRFISYTSASGHQPEGRIHLAQLQMPIARPRQGRISEQHRRDPSSAIEVRWRLANTR
jgi:hypothetical protein